ncbi:glycosyltransferase [Palleronia abyssalis]|uniref:GalNAc-alpha-(1->4)-GalNAc-alpha-(1->3)-diNAcBac-PP-undecaprenol alpha-1,4-N-acetyl-D-galactosaminyltransferase n=1 Tax=Palleronia abyssalis TaxID=1501240 RepID=A0A2R8BU55_9RHOB|nr:glycosyltransferase [Palleronia abyssalis]SPJ23663.1 GalNAc-alpha-(1->4)-GalNAc-alpha-(1->3)-diNAcBac-PP-undecaprenol alpha-1,4-N-acetyl-D-galactosaminyltransferase [Palleronia abyssalis]
MTVPHDTERRRPEVALVQAGLGSGGTEKVLARLAAHLAGRGYGITMVSIHGDPQAPYYPVPDTVHLRSMEAERGAAAANSTRQRIAWLRMVLRDRDLALSCLTKINVQTALATAGLGVRRIASERNNFKRQKMNPLWRWSMPFALATADRVVMQTAAARDALPRWAMRRSVIVPNPVPDPNAAAFEAPTNQIVAVGRLTAQKGFDTLLRALAIARDRGHPMPLTLYGVGELRDQLIGLSRSLNLQELAHFAGRSKVPHGWANRPSIFVLSSRFEGFPNVLIEAMAAGFAVVSTRCDWGPSEIVTSGTDGLLVAMDDPDAMADALIRLHEDTALRARLATSARVRAADYAEARVMEHWESVIVDALTSRISGPSLHTTGGGAHLHNGSTTQSPVKEYPGGGRVASTGSAPCPPR